METRTDPVFGELRYEPEHRHYKARMFIAGAEVDVELESKNYGDPGKFLESARGIWAAVCSDVDAAKAYACELLLPLKNETWLEENETPVTAETFLARLRLESVTLRVKDPCTYYFADGDLFWGHHIIVWRNADGTFDGADLAG